MAAGPSRKRKPCLGSIQKSNRIRRFVSLRKPGRRCPWSQLAEQIAGDQGKLDYN